MIINALNGVQSDTFILQIIDQQEFKKSANYLRDKSYLADTKIPVKIKDIHKIKKYNSIGISGFDYKNKVRYPIHVSKMF